MAHGDPGQRVGQCRAAVADPVTHPLSTRLTGNKWLGCGATAGNGIRNFCFGGAWPVAAPTAPLAGRLAAGWAGDLRGGPALHG